LKFNEQTLQNGGMRCMAREDVTVKPVKFVKTV
jgi:hypothetical protein